MTAVRGFKDILPQEIPYYALVEDAMREMARRYGYEEIRPPVLERTGLFRRGIGEATDIVEKEMYSFQDPGGESLTLRPEATAGIARAVMEHGLLEGALAGGRALRLFAMGPMFRHERPQKGRLRQFNQLDVEAFGDKGPYIDAEVMALLMDILGRLGIGGLEARVNSLGCEVCRPPYRERLVGYLSSRREELCEDCRRRLGTNPLRVLDCKRPGCREVARSAPTSLDGLCPECLAHFDGVKGSLSALGIPFSVDPLLVRGLDYYKRTAFEVLSGGLGAQSAVAGGGRYDGLTALLGGPDAPAIGFAVGVERLVMLLKGMGGRKAPAVAFYLAPLTEQALPRSAGVARALRASGHSVAYDGEALRLKTHLKRADKLGAAMVLMVGEDELAGGYATLRDLRTHAQERVPLAELEAGKAPAVATGGITEGPLA
ncbi:MAG: histidine--tRNA ligase [Deltaproteobacteria bacterium]|jgi:histidyl-tRNA synthetase|nr:histidine--tRNA ligase [Deltaproteobacteria bacterium]